MNKKVDQISSIRAKGIHNRYDLDIDLREGLNILHGRNGTGKTTLLHMLANILNGDILRFVFIPFTSICVKYHSGNELQINGHSNNSLLDVYWNGNRVRSLHENDINLPLKDEVAFQEDNDLYERFDLVEKLNKEILEEEGLSFPGMTYFPAFRTMLEAWVSQRKEKYRPRSFFFHSEDDEKNRIEFQTKLARKLFGSFVPSLSYPSPLDIKNRLLQELQAGRFDIANFDSQLFSSLFLDVFSSIFEEFSKSNASPDNIMREIENITKEIESSPLAATSDRSMHVYPKLRSIINSVRDFEGERQPQAVKVLEIYRDALITRNDKQKIVFKEIKKYIKAVNTFFEQKKVDFGFSANSVLVGVKFSDSILHDFKILSSGERQILTMIYAATRMNEYPIVLIDEPELSLHVDWQRTLLSSMVEQLGGRQIIVCTHSPTIAAEHWDKMQEVKPSFYN